MNMSSKEQLKDLSWKGKNFNECIDTIIYGTVNNFLFITKEEIGKKRFCIQIKWYSIFNDIIEYKNNKIINKKM